ncbi:RNA polymerase sigma factor [Marinigracilibium pacificum]|uniref:RNA polymerase sigma factor n=1 Tax=Marinigracilibium pacificum TaxID=2729599 RepID=A0A848J3Z4_9BACT|nr:RNA polymerase sigma factor [Marinigracilibium pacificum]NMM49204.1 RNA polymerase sigma factor [Marinigracilibium pacificum]
MSSEQILIEACKKQDPRAQEQLYTKFAPGMYAVCLRYSKSTLEAEDILQEAFIKVFRKISTYKGDSSLGYWIKRIVINTAINSQRSKLYMFPMVDVEDVNIVNPAIDALNNLNHQDLLKMIKELPDGCRVIFNLYAVEGYKHSEIADMLEISEGTSKSQFARARQLLKEMAVQRNILKNERAR